MLKDLCFEVIQTCPNKCQFCSSNSSQEAKTIITLEDFKRTVMHFMKKYGIEFHSIYEDLERVVVPGGKRQAPLCKQIYGFHGDLTENEER